MKKIHLLFALLFISLVNAQTGEQIQKQEKIGQQRSDKPHKPADVTRFPGGEAEFYKFFFQNFMPKKNKLRGTTRLYVSFTIEKDGTLSNIYPVHDPGNGIGDEAVRVMKMSPPWIPLLVDGKPAAESVSVPIVINK